ncbi:MAG: hypothetical protein QOH30_1673 [Baekduia sp.]|nr:hypothetical protein [Baekduia sp.]
MSPKRPTVGDVYRSDLLHSQASYRVLTVEDEHVEVEVVDAPGLQPGFRLKLTRAALEAMQREERATSAATAAARSATPRHVTSQHPMGA